MKKLIIGLLCTVLLLTFVPLQAGAVAFEEPTSLVVSKPPALSVSAGMNRLVKRRDEGKSIEKSRSDSNAKNGKSIDVSSNRHSSHSHGGVYVSGGGVLLLILLLIIII